MHQNRVDPFGRIFATSARGRWMGNRGVIHNEHQQVTHAFRHKAWITCVLEFKGRKRSVMALNRWTELFFLDEATAFAAGHRPCFECRREDAIKFKSCWIAGNPSYGFTMKTSINRIDEIMHSERIDSNKKKVTHHVNPSDIPEGAFVLLDEKAFLFYQGRFHLWTPFGYESIITVPQISSLIMLTPLSIANAFRAGYMPQMNNLHNV